MMTRAAEKEVESILNFSAANCEYKCDYTLKMNMSLNADCMKHSYKHDYLTCNIVNVKQKVNVSM